MTDLDMRTDRFELMGAVQHVTAVAPPSTLDAERNMEDKASRRLNKSIVNGQENALVGIIKNLDAGDAVSFLKEKSRSVEQGMAEVLTEQHGAGPVAQPKPSLAQRPRPKTTPTPRPR